MGRAGLSQKMDKLYKGFGKIVSLLRNFDMLSEYYQYINNICDYLYLWIFIILSESDQLSYISTECMNVLLSMLRSNSHLIDPIGLILTNWKNLIGLIGWHVLGSMGLRRDFHYYNSYYSCKGSELMDDSHCYSRKVVLLSRIHHHCILELVLIFLNIWGPMVLGLSWIFTLSSHLLALLLGYRLI